MENGVKRFFYDDFNLRLRVMPHKKKDRGIKRSEYSV